MGLVRYVIPTLLAALLGAVGFLWHDREVLGNRLTAVEVHYAAIAGEVHDTREDVRELRRVLLGK